MAIDLSSALIIIALSVNTLLCVGLLVALILFGGRSIRLLQEGRDFLSYLSNEAPRVDDGTWDTGVDDPGDEEYLEREQRDDTEYYNPRTYPTGTA